MYAKVIRILSKGYLPISLIPPLKLQDILGRVKKAIQATNPDSDIVTERLHLYCDMKLGTFGIDSFHAAIYTTATDIISNRNSPSSHCR